MKLQKHKPEVATYGFFTPSVYQMLLAYSGFLMVFSEEKRNTILFTNNVKRIVILRRKIEGITKIFSIFKENN